MLFCFNIVISFSICIPGIITSDVKCVTLHNCPIIQRLACLLLTVQDLAYFKPGEKPAIVCRRQIQHLQNGYVGLSAHATAHWHNTMYKKVALSTDLIQNI
jgi:hypothetical protein